MPRSETIINVFVASPSDVAEERNSLEIVVHELNKTWSKKLGLRLDLIKWETDVYPSFGDSAQDVINNQINDSYDIFIAIFWSKLGTPTKKSISGSVEEFERAYSKYKRNEEVDIMVYFKDQAIPPSKMDFEQLKGIQDLKTQLGEKGGLYWTFDGTENFESLLRVHLSQVAQKWASKTSTALTEVRQLVEIKEEECIDEFEDFGLLEYIDIYEDRISEMTASLAIMAEATERVGNQFNRRTEEITELGEIGESNKAKARKIIKLTSHDIDRFTEITNGQIEITSKSREEAFHALSMALSVYVDFINTNEPDEELIELENSLISMRDVTEETIKSIIEFQTSLSNLPRLTVHVNRSKRLAVKALDSVLKEVATTNQSATNVLKSVLALKESIKT